MGNYEPQRQSMRQWHAEHGHLRQEWSALRLPKEIVEWIRNFAEMSETSPTEYIVSRISCDGFRYNNQKTNNPNQMELFKE